MDALVVFHGHGCHVVSRLLKTGFSHVFVAVRAGEYWISIDMRAGVPVIEAVAPGGYDLAAFYRDQGFIVIETSQRDKPLRGPFAVANCVGNVKAILSLRSSAITPYGLYRHLRRNP